MSLENILLLSCRSSYLDSDKIYPPLANLYLYSAIKKENPNTKVTITDDYNLNNYYWADGYDAIGISIMTQQRTEARKILNYVKRNTNAITIAGGPHCKYYINEMKEEPWDYIVPYDGIRAINQIIKGRKDRIIRDNINTIEYQNEWVKPNRLDNAEFLRTFNYKLGDVDSTTAFFAQGCPMKCTFCEDAMSSVRWTPFNLIKEELDDIKNLGYKGLYIFDYIFAIAMPKVKPICDEIQKRGIVYRCNGQANFFTKWGEDFAKMLSQTGCKEIAFGHESGSQEILDNVRKQTSVGMNYLSVEYAKRHNIKVKSFLMIGLPGETYETIKQTERFIQTSGIDDFQLAIYYPYKGTQIRDAIDKGQNMGIRIESEGLGAYGQKGGKTEAVIRTSQLSSQELLSERDRLVDTYKPKSHNAHYEGLFEEHLK